SPDDAGDRAGDRTAQCAGARADQRRLGNLTNRGRAMADSLVIRGGQVVLPDAAIAADLLVSGETIAAVLAPGANVPAGTQVIDAAGCLVFPGVVDPHTHIQLDTGIYQTPDDWEIGTRTAAFGGVTTVIDFATQFPGMTFEQALDARLAECAPAMIDYGLHMMVTEL